MIDVMRARFATIKFRWRRYDGVGGGSTDVLHLILNINGMSGP